MKGTKYDEDKPRWSLVPFKQMTEVVEVLTFGAKKYSDDNWKKVPNGQIRYYDALMRHATKYKYLSKLDKETKKSHLAHVICCALFLMGYDDGEGIDELELTNKAKGYKVEPDENLNIYQSIPIPIPIPIVDNPMADINQLKSKLIGNGETPHKCSLDTTPKISSQEKAIRIIKQDIENNTELTDCMEYPDDNSIVCSVYEYQGDLCDPFKFSINRFTNIMKLIDVDNTSPFTQQEGVLNNIGHQVDNEEKLKDCINIPIDDRKSNLYCYYGDLCSPFKFTVNVDKVLELYNE